MGTKGYHSYRGRRGARHVLGIVLLALILLAACVYLFLQRYVTFTDSGEVRLDLPFFQQEEQVPDEEPPRMWSCCCCQSKRRKKALKCSTVGPRPSFSSNIPPSEF